MTEKDLIIALRSLDESVEPSDELREVIWQPLAARLQAEPIRRRPNQTGRSALWGGLRTMAIAAVVVLVVGIGAMLLTKGDDSPLADPGASVSVPDSHPAAQLVADGIPSFSTVEEALRVSSHESWGCGLNRDTDWQLCYVYADGVLALITFDNPQGTTARVIGDGLGGEVTVPIDGSQLIGIASSGGQIRYVIERDGEYAGSAGRGMGTNLESEAADKGY